MAEIGSIPLSKIEPLTGPNYLTWSLKMGLVLKSRKIFREVIESEEPPTSNDPNSNEAKNHQVWEDKNNEAFGLIILTLSDELAGLFINETKAKNVWKELEKMYTGNIQDQRIDVGIELKNTSMGDKEKVDDYITRVRNIATRSARLGQVIPERELVYFIVRGLAQKFEKIALVLRTQRAISLEELHQTLREEENRILSRKPDLIQPSNERAYKAKVWTAASNPKKITETRRCYICKKNGHIARDCWFRQGSSGLNRARGPRMDASHPKRKAENNSKRTSENAMHTMEEDTAPQEQEVAHWSIDSGSTSHMTSRRDWMENVKPCTVEVNLAEVGRKIKAEERGDIHVAVRGNNNELRNVCIKDVLYVPNLRGNLLSVKSLVEKGNEVIFQQEDTRIIGIDGQILARPIERNKMFILETFPQDVNAFNIKEDVKSARRDVKADSKELWHRRLGHVNESYMDQLKRCEMVKGINFRAGKLLQCEECILGKLTQNPFRMVDYDNIKEPLELLHMDLCGPMPEPSLGGAKYLFTIVDTYSRRVFTYFLVSKDEVYEQFITFKNRVENELNKRIKSVRTDNGKEFLNQQFEDLFKISGINHQRTTHYTPQSNGVAERMNRTIVDKTRTMLLDSRLPLPFWAEAAATATYLKNRSPFQNGGNQTPMERWSNAKPNVSYLKVFGAMAYYYVPKPIRNRMEPKAKRGIFVGYSRVRRAYRVYDPESNKIVETRTAKFDESRRGAEMLGINDNVNESAMSFEWNNLQEAKTEDQHSDQAEDSHKPSAANDCQTCEGVSYSMLETEETVPNTYEEAITSPFRKEWRDSMDKEIQSLNEHCVWDLVDAENVDTKILKNKWVYSVKRNPDGSIRRKARLVAVGCGQRPGEDYQESFSPVIRKESLRLLIALAAQLNLNVRLFDVKTAYLYGELEETVFMRQPDGYIDADNPNKVCHLKKSIYGLPQSGRCWNKRLNEVLESIGLRRASTDPCIYSYKEGNEVLFVGVYVDDLIVLASDGDLIEQNVQKLREYFTITETSLDNTGGAFLNIEIKRTENGYELSQKKYIEKILKKYGLENCNPVKTPGDDRQNLDECNESQPLEDKAKYQEMVGSLMYLSMGTRPDIAYSVTRLSQYNNNPRNIHLTAVKRVYRYLQGTKDYKLVFNNQEGATIEASADASWSCTHDAKSFSGYVLKLGSCVVSWKAQKQGLVALSTCESELISISECVREVKWTVNLLEELGMEKFCRKPVIVKSDSRAAISLINREGVTGRTKHINRKFYYVRDEVAHGNLEVQFVRTEEMEADVLTKSLTLEKHNNCIYKLGLNRN